MNLRKFGLLVIPIYEAYPSYKFGLLVISNYRAYPSYKYTINWSSEWTTHVKYELGKWLQNGVLIVTENTPHMNFGPHVDPILHKKFKIYWTKITKYLPDGRKHLGHHPMVSQNPNLWQHWTIYIFLFEILLKNNNSRVKNEYLFKYKLTTN